MLSRIPAVWLATSLVLASLTRAEDPARPADPDLNPKGRAILSWFRELQASPDLKLVSGQFAGWSGSARMEVLAKIERATGQWPAMIGLDYCFWQDRTKGPDMPGIDTRPPNALARQYWHEGGLVNLSWHAPNPSGASLKEKGAPLADLLVPGPLHDRWLESLDLVAAGLLDLQDAGVVVIWRPLHEMNGGWFWWGAQEPAAFIAVWRHMFDYFTHTKQLHNLIWAYGPNQGARTAAFYPGDAYVDLIGFDAYTDHLDPAHIRGYPELAQINKPFGLTEYGPHAASNPPGDYDYRRLLDGLEKNFPAARHFLCWDQKWNPAENKFAREFYNDPRVITRASLPAGLVGNAKSQTPNSQ